MSFYGATLARAHDEGFGDLARGAAAELLRRLGSSGLDRGLVVDLGCGGGLLAAAVADAGYDVLGVDVSEAMVALARARVPAGRFVHGSVHDVALPPCVAVAAIGEVVNYAADPRAGAAAVAALIARVAAALVPGGVLLFDAAAPGRAGGRAWRAGGDWVVCAASSETGSELVREIVAFRREGDAWRRSDERHVLRLLPEASVRAALTDCGLRDVEPLDAYAGVELPAGLRGYAARR